MKTKLVYTGIVLLLIAGIFGIYELQKPAEKTGAKAITVVVVDESKDKKKTVLNETYHTDTKNLTEFLKEQKEIDAVIEKSNYGSLLTEIKDLKQNMDNGPWIVFESKNNKVCIKAGMCPVMDDVVIEDQDVFTFRYITKFE